MKILVHELVSAVAKSENGCEKELAAKFESILLRHGVEVPYLTKASVEEHHTEHRKRGFLRTGRQIYINASGYAYVA